MALGKAAVFKRIPVYYPDQVGVVGGAVGAIGGLGGFVLPLAFGIMSDLTDVWTICFTLLFGFRIDEPCMDALRDRAPGAGGGTRDRRSSISPQVAAGFAG